MHEIKFKKKYLGRLDNPLNWTQMHSWTKGIIKAMSRERSFCINEKKGK